MHKNTGYAFVRIMTGEIVPKVLQVLKVPKILRVLKVILNFRHFSSL